MHDAGTGREFHHGGGAPVELELDPGLHRRIVDHLRAALPNEGVGLLAVEWERDGTRSRALPRKFFPGTNIRQSAVRYQMDWSELVAALREIDANAWVLGAIVHSHPRGPAMPSVTDLAEAWYPDALMVIASFAAEPPDLRAWILEGEEGAWTPREAAITAAPPPDNGAGIAPVAELRE